MSILTQKTVKKIISIDGVGLHTGKKVNLKINPSAPNTGIIFKRTDIKINNIVFPNVFNVSNVTLCTTISNDFGVKVSTIEHLMGALFGKGIDNALIEIDSEEVPILDGSAKEFVSKIDQTGILISDIPIKIIKIEKKVTHKDGEKFITIEPSKISLDINFELKYNNELIGKQKNLVKVYQEDLTDVYNSRTFCLYEDIEKLRAMNLVKGGNLSNAIVVKKEKILNEGGLRNEKEFVNHKILDCIGDLYLAGYKMLAKIDCSQGGHKLTNELLRKVLSEDSNYSIIEIKANSLPKSILNNTPLRSIA